MIGKAISWVAGSAIRRWAVGAIVALVLGGGALKWHNFKEDLIHKGQQVCVQEINKQTVTDLENALVEERLVTAELVLIAQRYAAVNAKAVAREREANLRAENFQNELNEERNNNEEYKAWASNPLPLGVADRLRSLSTGSTTHPGNEDSN
jgi:hypothetical protein